MPKPVVLVARDACIFTARLRSKDFCFLHKLLEEALMIDVLDTIPCFDLKLARRKDVFVSRYW